MDLILKTEHIYENDRQKFEEILEAKKENDLYISEKYIFKISDDALIIEKNDNDISYKKVFRLKNIENSYLKYGNNEIITKIFTEKFDKKNNIIYIKAKEMDLNEQVFSSIFIILELKE